MECPLFGRWKMDFNRICEDMEIRMSECPSDGPNVRDYYRSHARGVSPLSRNTYLGTEGINKCRGLLRGFNYNPYSCHLVLAFDYSGWVHKRLRTLKEQRQSCLLVIRFCCCGGHAGGVVRDRGAVAVSPRHAGNPLLQLGLQEGRHRARAAVVFAPRFGIHMLQFSIPGLSGQNLTKNRLYMEVRTNLRNPDTPDKLMEPASRRKVLFQHQGSPNIACCNGRTCMRSLFFRNPRIRKRLTGKTKRKREKRKARYNACI